MVYSVWLLVKKVGKPQVPSVLLHDIRITLTCFRCVWILSECCSTVTARLFSTPQTFFTIALLMQLSAQICTLMQLCILK